MNEVSLEGLKLIFDFVKHITTLDTGLILILATLLEKVFPKEGVICRRLIPVCIFFLGSSIAGSLIFLGLISYWMIYVDATKWAMAPVTYSLYVSIIGFFAALIVFIIFTYKNYPKSLLF
jgi:hypothetical protein